MNDTPEKRKKCWLIIKEIKCSICRRPCDNTYKICTFINHIYIKWLIAPTPQYPRKTSTSCSAHCKLFCALNWVTSGLSCNTLIFQPGVFIYPLIFFITFSPHTTLIFLPFCHTAHYSPFLHTTTFPPAHHPDSWWVSSRGHQAQRIFPSLPQDPILVPQISRCWHQHCAIIINPVQIFHRLVFWSPLCTDPLPH